MTGQPASKPGTKPGTKYETDYVAWTREQAEMLRSRRWDSLDLDHLIEEIEDLGDNKLDAFEGALTRVVEHLLKLQHGKAAEPRRGWKISVATHRVNAARLLRRAKSLRKLADLDEIYADGRKLAAKSFESFGDTDPAILPAHCPYTLDQILDLDWLPENAGFPEPDSPERA
ncbi:DUF29 domain-containing protein [Skermanella sp. TT6]|uniref:DUF29 domain-containing protein n=1 Tax=Skermanella cutis TaxID=2775420 RepID=A0ABX7B3X4_9PROT|nr:DUF29 domain-containing protein [Skermanella sp. TT6]QQP89035.1 DUF29 domain-containing protein [Skermanella sp. TT6]